MEWMHVVVGKIMAPNICQRICQQLLFPPLPLFKTSLPAARPAPHLVWASTGQLPQAALTHLQNEAAGRPAGVEV